MRIELITATDDGPGGELLAIQLAKDRRGELRAPHHEADPTAIADEAEGARRGTILVTEPGLYTSDGARALAETIEAMPDSDKPRVLFLVQTRANPTVADFEQALRPIAELFPDAAIVKQHNAIQKQTPEQRYYQRMAKRWIDTMKERTRTNGR